MNNLNYFSSGISYFFKAIPFIFKHKLWYALVIPLVLNLILYLSGTMLIDTLGDSVSEWVKTKMDIESESSFMQSLPGVVSGIIHIIFQIGFFFLFAYFSGYVILIVLSPLFAWVSERTDQIINHTDYPFEWKQFFKDIWRGIVIALRNLFIETGLTVLILIATLIPILNILTGPLSFVLLLLLSSYFYGFSYMDYVLERKRYKVKESVRIIRKYKGLAIGNGLIFSLTLLIPFCGITLAGVSAIIATVGAALAMNDLPEIKDKHIQPQKNTQL